MLDGGIGPLVHTQRALKGALPEGRWGIVSAGRGNNPSVTLRVPPPFTQGRLLRTHFCQMPVGDADHCVPRADVVIGPYTRPTDVRTYGDEGKRRAFSNPDLYFLLGRISSQ